MRRIGVLTYDIPHRKTHDTLCLLKAKGYNEVTVFGKELHYKKKFKPIYSHRPENIYSLHPKLLCDNLGYKYTLTEVSENDLDYGSIILVCGAGIIDDELINNYKVINSHPGYIPNCRGLDAYKWAIYENEPIGVSTHVIGEYIDAGEIIERVKIPIFKADTFHSVAQRLYEFEIKMLVDAVEKINDQLQYIKPDGYVVHKRMPSEIEVDIINLFNIYKHKVGE